MCHQKITLKVIFVHFSFLFHFIYTSSYEEINFHLLSPFEKGSYRGSKKVFLSEGIKEGTRGIPLKQGGNFKGNRVGLKL